MTWETEPTLTANQVVAANLHRARKLRGWTQEEAGRRIAAYLGEPWSKASWSAAERSVTGERIRNFDADELVAFSRLFELPVGWFLLPTEADLLLHPDAKPIPRADLLRLATRLNAPEVLERLRELLPGADPAAWLGAHVPNVDPDDIATLERWVADLHGLADRLGAQLADLGGRLSETTAAYSTDTYTDTATDHGEDAP